MERNEDSAPEAGARDRILDAAFAAFKELGYAQASTLEIATRARVSKRELYALFGSKQQMLVECISERSRTRMRPPADLPAVHDRAALEAVLVGFGATLLREITDPDVIAVFRLAVAEAERAPEIAQALDTHGRQVSRASVREILQQAQAAGLLDRTDPGRMASQFMALLVEDRMVTLMLGVSDRPSAAEAQRRAREAAAALLRLHA